MTALPPGLIWLASYPKSGNTWMRVLLANLLAGGDTPSDINRLSEGDTLIGRWRFGDDMLVDPDILTASELAVLRRLQCDFVAPRLTEPFVCKTHDRFDAALLGTGARRTLYLVRDPRDVAISLAHHSSLSIDRAITQMLDAACFSDGPLQLRYPLGDWASHVVGWTRQDVLPMMVVRYEDLRRNTAATMAHVVAFLNGSASATDLGRAVTHSRLEELQRQEASSGFRESMPGQRRFFRSGRVGEWRDALSHAQIERIETGCLPAMERWGYTPSQ